jgi:hypothetical protein
MEQAARAVLSDLGYTDADVTALNERLGYDWVATCAESFRQQFTPGVLRTDPATSQTMLRVSMTEETYRTLAGFVDERRAALPPQPPSTPSESIAAANGIDQAAILRQQAEQRANTQEGAGSFIEGALAGDFSDNQSWSKVGGQTLVGFIPIAGQIADARDTVAAIGDRWASRQECRFRPRDRAHSCPTC